MNRSCPVFQVFVILLLAFACLPPVHASDQSPGVIGEPYRVQPGSSGSQSLNYTGCGGVNVPVVNAAYEQAVLDLVNTERANRSIPPLKRVTALDYAARYHATDLGQDNYFEHDSYDRENGALVFECDTWDRILNYYAFPSAENIAAGYTTPENVMNGWMNSSGHRDNILRTSNWTIGVGYNAVDGSEYTHYWVQDFGHPSNEYPLIINRDAASTTDRDVSIYIYGTFTQMRLKNGNDAWGAWQPFQNNISWVLPNGKGERTVTAELKTGSTTNTSSDSIFLDGQTTPSLGNLPDAFTFLYSIPDARLYPANASFIPLDVNTSLPLMWTITASGTWFEVAPVSGVTPQAFQVTPDNFDGGTTNTYTGSVTINVTNPSEVDNSPHTIELTLIVFDNPIYRVFLPTTFK